MRKQIAAANWKMNLTLNEANELLDNLLSKNITISDDQQVVMAVPFPYLLPANKKIENNKGFCIAAQNCYSKKSGAFTGEVSAPIIASCGIEYVLIGHSERRE